MREQESANIMKLCTSEISYKFFNDNLANIKKKHGKE